MLVMDNPFGLKFIISGGESKAKLNFRKNEVDKT
jgi:hypothetical protein